MNLNESISGDINTKGGDEKPLCIGLIPDAFPEVQKPIWVENSQTGVSTKNALSGTIPKVIKKKIKEVPRWYALRTTYGREKKAYDYLVGEKIEAFYPTITTVKVVNGKRKFVEESRLPNIFFAYGTEKEIKSYVYDNINLPYLRFYYRHFYKGTRIVKEPLIVPDDQIESLKIICTSESEDVILIPTDIEKFQTGQKVCVIDGCFKGVEGRVARYHGQQRVAVIISGLLTVATAYIPSAFLKPTD